MALNFTEEQLDNLERNCVNKQSSRVSISQSTLEALIDQAREATRIPYLERQLSEQICDKQRLYGEYQTVIEQHRIKEIHDDFCRANPDFVDIVSIDNDD